MTMTDHELSPTEYQPDVTDMFGPDDDIAEAFRANSFVEAQMIASTLGTLDHMEGARVMVRRDDLGPATVIVQEVVDREKLPATPEGDAELTRLAEQSEGFSDPQTGAQV
jgi:hypothetical protein